jgi:hypothetical protein
MLPKVKSFPLIFEILRSRACDLINRW